MRWGLAIAVALAGVAISVLVWMLTGGKVAFFFLPLLFLGLPLLGRRR